MFSVQSELSLSRMSGRVSNANTHVIVRRLRVGRFPFFPSKCLCAVCSEFVRFRTARSVQVVYGVLSRSVELL